MVSGRSSATFEVGIRTATGATKPEDEAAYWKQIAEEYIAKLQYVREEFEEYREGSQELEAELETQLEQYERRVADLMNCKCELEEENQLQKEKLNENEQNAYMQITQLQDENAQLKDERNQLSKYVRDLEQMNDDLERSKRATICSLEEFEVRLNNAIERNAFLENELEEKEQLMVAVQRLKDESRDLKAELAKNARGKNNGGSGGGGRNSNASSGRNSAGPHRNSSTTPRPASKGVGGGVGGGGEGWNPGAISMFVSQIPFTKNNGSKVKMSALNIVGDLINKVGALEEKLATCRNFSQDEPRGGGGGGGGGEGVRGGVGGGEGVAAMIDSVNEMVNGAGGKLKNKAWH